jgi:hypothetical protein
MVMRRSLILCSAILAVAFSPSAIAQDAESILRKVQALEHARWDGVNNYVVDQAMMGHRTLLFYEKIQVPAPGGGTVPAFRLVPPDEVALRQREEQGFPQLTPEDLRRFSQAAATTGDALGSETERSMEEAGLPAGLLSAAGPNRFATLDPRVMMGNVSEFTDAAADAQAAAESRDPTAEAREAQAGMADFARTARLAGTETIGGREAFILRADDVNHTQRTADGQTFTIRTATFWVDTAEYVPLKFRMEGVAASQGEQRELVIEKQDQDYRQVGSLYLPYRQVMRIAGMMNAEQEARMREAQQQMAEMEQQMAQMPESQRQMMTNMMGPQIEMMRTMASGGGIQMVTDIYEVRVNVGLPDQVSMGSVLFQPQASTGPSAAPATTDPIRFAPAGSAASMAPPATTAPTQESRRLAQQQCLQEKVAAAQASQKKKRGLGRLMNAVARTAMRSGNHDFARTAGDVYHANATVEDLAAAARDLGLTEDEVAACQNPL